LTKTRTRIAARKAVENYGMSEMAEAAKSEPAKPAMFFAKFLESSPPETEIWVSDVVDYDITQIHGTLHVPDIRIHCDYEECNGIRTFSSASAATISSAWHLVFLSYVCRNCHRTGKNFALLIMKDKTRASSACVCKLGELPIFGPPTPSRLVSLVGEDRELFLKGRRAEQRGLGIGAFAYYRRVVENQKGRIIGEIGKVAARLGASAATLKLFAEAEKETQFSTAIEKIKAAIPESVRINGQNPLTLLHSALSEGLHAGTDAECLEIATDIRVVLADLAERISIALKDEAELRGAVNRLLNRNSKAT